MPPVLVSMVDFVVDALFAVRAYAVLGSLVSHERRVDLVDAT